MDCGMWIIHNPFPMSHNPDPIIHIPKSIIHYGLWIMEYGLWIMDYDCYAQAQNRRHNAFVKLSGVVVLGLHSINPEHVPKSRGAGIPLGPYIFFL